MEASYKNELAELVKILWFFFLQSFRCFQLAILLVILKFAYF